MYIVKTPFFSLRCTPSNRSSAAASNTDQDSDTMSVNTTGSAPRSVYIGPSPRVKKDKRKATEDKTLDKVRSNLNPKPPPNKDKSAQYNKDCTPDAGDT